VTLAATWQTSASASADPQALPLVIPQQQTMHYNA
jgi:hypothetical protein